MNIGQLLLRRATESADSIAIGEPSTLENARPGLTYAGLLDLAIDITSWLAGVGIDRGDRVAVVGPNGPEMASAFLTVGAFTTVAPLNPRYRRSEYDFYLADLEAKALIVWDEETPAAVESAEGLGIRVVRLVPGEVAGMYSLECSGISEDVERSAEKFSSDADQALVLHTSGTTARPKIVPLTHTNLCSNAAYIANTLELTSDDRSLVVMPLFHIHGLIGVLLSTVFSGGTALCTPGFSAEHFFDWLNAVRPTWYSAAPTMHQSVLAGLEAGSVAEDQRLRFIRSSSASLPPAVINGLESRLGIPMIEAYGMTEASHQMCINPLPPGVRKPGSVGPAAGRVDVVDEDGNRVSARVEGDVITTGPNVTLGYENNDIANLDSFDNGWFKTGDLGYLDEDGYLFLTGRKKEIINRGGEKVSPREVDDVLSEHPSVQQVVTFAVPHATLGEDVAAAIVVRPDHPFSEREIRQFALQRLAGFKVPSFLVEVEEIPKGATGKLQRIRLAELLADNLMTHHVAPQSPTEAAVAEIWTELLDVNQVGSSDNFFQIGGDSIMAARVVGRIRDRLGVSLPLTTVFHEPTVRDFAKAIDELQIVELGVDAVGDLLDELDSLSEEEAIRLLADE